MNDIDDPSFLHPTRSGWGFGPIMLIGFILGVLVGAAAVIITAPPEPKMMYIQPE